MGWIAAAGHGVLERQQRHRQMAQAQQHRPGQTGIGCGRLAPVVQQVGQGPLGLTQLHPGGPQVGPVMPGVERIGRGGGAQSVAAFVNLAVEHELQNPGCAHGAYAGKIGRRWRRSVTHVNNDSGLGLRAKGIRYSI